MLRLQTIVGIATDSALTEALHDVEHRNGIEYITLSEADTQRHRLRVITDRGTECAIALPRTQQLADGAVLLLERERAVIVRMHTPNWLVIRPRDAAAALEVGYFAGNMHWKVEFGDGALRILLQGPEDAYLQRLMPLLADGRAVRAR